MPEGCAKLLGKHPPPQPEPLPPPTSVATTASGTTTAPPIWHPPESNVPPPVSSGGSEYLKVKAAAESKNFKKVKELLDKKAKDGKANDDEVRWLHEACTALKDKKCLSMLHNTYDHGTDPDDPPEPPPPPASKDPPPKKPPAKP
jgi:hypothetical protein